ncbi:unnamed protein product [Cyprideis torosa]|uniref:Protein-lysine N-methyltransferase SMYD4 n=1 Tax=Cyprideis torosa TaxID=163714 RepID=A0A7R8ZI89_9CRUS|nr:unnamed protein product [Cyprideis torosa]CAG0884288.1 unnamed protein product [Cyprideis torosa]
MRTRVMAVETTTVVFGEAPESDDEVDLVSDDSRVPSMIAVEPESVGHSKSRDRRTSRGHSGDLLHLRLRESKAGAISGTTEIAEAVLRESTTEVGNLHSELVRTIALVKGSRCAAKNLQNTLHALHDSLNMKSQLLCVGLKSLIQTKKRFRRHKEAQSESNCFFQKLEKKRPALISYSGDDRKCSFPLNAMAVAVNGKLPPYTFEKFHADLIKSVESSLEERSKEFAALSSDVDRFAFVWQLPFVKDFEITKWKNPFRKNNRRADEARTEGNTSYRSGQYYEALICYNASILHAEIPSKELSLALSNRSAIFKQWDMFEETLIDVNWALDSWVTEHKKECPELFTKLTNRKEECEEAIKQRSEKAKEEMQKGRRPFPPPLPSLGSQNSLVPSANQAVEMRISPLRGRHLVASTDIRPGEILFVERPYSRVILPDSMLDFCQRCINKVFGPPRPFPCEGCSRVVYCSRECSSADVTDGLHAWECPVLALLDDPDLGKMGLLSYRTVLKALSSAKDLDSLLSPPVTPGVSESKASYDPAVYWNTYRLVTNSVHRKVGDLFRRASMACYLVKIMNLTESAAMIENNKDDKMAALCSALGASPALSSSLEIMAGGLLLTHLQNMPCNAHEVTCLSIGKDVSEMVVEEIAAAAYPTLSLLNHSCDPNVVRHSVGDAVVARSIKPIAKDSEIVDNYGYHYAVMGKDDRQKGLQYQYFFSCDCVACENDWKKYEELSPEQVKIPPNNPFEEAFKKVLSQEDYSDDVQKVFIEFLEFLDRNYSEKRPFKEYNDCQEALKQCFGFHSNSFAMTASVAPEALPAP